MNLLYPPSPLTSVDWKNTVFLAGSIDMGKAEDWQTEVLTALDDTHLTFLNPRRPDWNTSWEQRKSDPNFREQVEWELEAQENASLIAMYFAPGSQSPITLLEMGLFARTKKLLVCCPDGFWRKGNIEVVCARYGIPLLSDLDALISGIRAGWSAQVKSS